MTTIAHFDARLLRVPLTRPWASDVTSVGVIATHVVRSDGAEGWGFSWTPQIGAEAALALLQYDIAPAALGRDADPEADDLAGHAELARRIDVPLAVGENLASACPSPERTRHDDHLG